MGQDYLRRYPSEADKTRLVQQLPGVDPGRPLLAQFSTLQSRFVEDFTAGRVVGVDGWVLAVTEARAAAAIALGA